jgi:hypothetical protein
MVNTLQYFKLAEGSLKKISILTVFAMASIFFFAPQARAEYPNILVGSDMTTNSTGQGVVVLQGLMSELGYLNVPMGVPLGYYGGLTKTAVAQYQASRGVAPAVGYYGSVTKSSMRDHLAGHDWLSLLDWD